MSILKVVFVIIGTLIGAGFASGQEVYIFFYSYGVKGILGIIISSGIIGFTIYKTLKITKENNIENYKGFLDYFIKKEKLKELINSIINIFILISFYVMIAGFGAYLEQEINLNSFIGSSILAFLCVILFKTNIKGIVKINEILIPILIAVVLVIRNIQNIDINTLNNHIGSQKNESLLQNWFITSILYASYNCILLIPVLISIKELILKNKNIKYISILVSIIMIILLSVIFLFLINVDVDIKQLQMPAVYAISNIWPKIKKIYGIIILISIFTTAISLGMGFLKNVVNNKRGFNTISILMCISSVIFSGFGFSNLVNLLYPILGVFGLIQIIQICAFKK